MEMPRRVAPRDRAPPRGARGLVLGLLAVTLIATVMLFVRLGEPKPFWDESYYLPAAGRYELGYASFAAHPPLGLMLIAAGDHVTGANRNVHWDDIARYKKIPGARMPASFSYLSIRWASAAFGVVAAALLFLLMFELIGQPLAAFIATAPFLFDSALVAQFRAAHLDAFQICFAAAALLCLVKGDRRPRPLWLFGFGLACGLAAMVRANALLLLVGGLLPCWRAWARLGSTWQGRLARAARAGGLVGAGAILAVAGVFLAHLVVAPRAMPAQWRAAQIDHRFATEPYRAYTEGRVPLSSSVIVAAADDYRHFMAADVARIGFKDPNGTSPWVWPLARRPIIYRWDSDGVRAGFVALVPNMAAWLLSLFGVVAALTAAVRLLAGKGAQLAAPDRPLLFALLGIWGVLFLSDLVLAQLRTMYLYHYFLPLIIGWVLAALLLTGSQPSAQAGARPSITALACILGCFTLVSPLALHGPMTERECRIRMALNGPALCDGVWTQNGGQPRR